MEVLSYFHKLPMSSSTHPLTTLIKSHVKISKQEKKNKALNNKIEFQFITKAKLMHNNRKSKAKTTN